MNQSGGGSPKPNDLVRFRLWQLDSEERWASLKLAQAMSRSHAAIARELAVQKAALEEHEKLMGQIAEKRRRHRENPREPIVIVRDGPGPRPSVFHPQRSVCGWMPVDRRQLLLSEAQSEGLSCCSSVHCRYALREASSG